MTRLALIGLGAWGKNILRTLAARSDCQVVAISDPQKPTEEMDSFFVGKEKPEHIADAKYLLERNDIDAVLIATPGTTHTEIALPFIKKGLSMFIEKPLTTNSEDARLLAQEATKSGAHIFVGHIHLYNPAYQKVKELLPTLGDIRLLSFEGMNNGPYRADMSALWDWAPHDIALALDLLQSEPTQVRAWNFQLLGKHHTDMTIANLSFPKQIAVTLQVSWLSPEKKKKLTIIGSQSSLVFNDTAEKKITLYENIGPTVGVNNIAKQSPSISYPDYSSTSPLENEMAAFMDMVITKNKPKSSIEQGSTVVKIIESIEKAGI